MVYGAINEKGEEFYTDMSRVFAAIRGKQRGCNWLITDFQGYPADQRISALFDREFCWISGEDLTDLVEKENFQWIFAVLSGFDKSVRLSEVLKYELPFADGYTGFWKKPLSIQHPLAKMEIVPWDSSLTLLFSREKEDVDNFLEFFPNAEYFDDRLERV